MIFHLVGGGGPIMGDLWALKGLIEEGISFFSPLSLFLFLFIHKNRHHRLHLCGLFCFYVLVLVFLVINDSF